MKTTKGGKHILVKKCNAHANAANCSKLRSASLYGEENHFFTLILNAIKRDNEYEKMTRKNNTIFIKI
jgi:hypothetical protein